MSNNSKGDLIEFCKRNGLETPVFETKATGPEHQPTFESSVLISSTIWATSTGRTKREAEKAAAQQTLENLEHNDPGAHNLDLEPNPWPIFPEVLAQCLNVANARVEISKRGQAATLEIRDLALELYKGLLTDLGEVV
jgi:ribonuclease III